MGRKEFPPDCLGYSRYLDKIADQRRAPQWTMSRNFSEPTFAVITAADRYQPGQYKIDRDFVEDITREVRKGVISDFASSRNASFAGVERTDSDGILRGIRNPGPMQLKFNPTG